jgi:FixJ family two-component response regulator
MIHARHFCVIARAPNLSAHQRDVMKLVVRALSNKESASILNLAEGPVKILRTKSFVETSRWKSRAC